MNELLSIEYLNECFSYNSETGVLIWKKRPLSHFDSEKRFNHWNKLFSNKCAGHIMINKYKSIKVGGIAYRAHRIAFAIYYGYWPIGFIDHINGNPSDNRIENLRDVTRKENTLNCRIGKNNKTGCIGVWWDTKKNMWVSSIKFNYQQIYLGRFVSLFEAVCVRKSKEIEFGFHENHGRRI